MRRHCLLPTLFFESISGLTTTGATVLTNIDAMSRAILFYRQQLQWLGGMGIIVLAVAILPVLGIGGMQLYRTEAPGPVKDRKLTPRIAETAKTLWYLYLGLTIACALAYWTVGMTPFDAITHSFATVAIGGFSTHDASIGWFNNPAIEGVAIFFMLVSGINFTMHYLAWHNRSFLMYFSDPEMRGYLLMLMGVCLLTVPVLFYNDVYDGMEAARYGIFEVVSVATTTGFSTADFSHWPTFLPLLLFLTSFAGGCAGSTAGGMKVIRVLLIFKQGSRELKRLIHPDAIFSIKLGCKPVDDKVADAVWGFFSAYVFLFIVMYLALLATGLDITTVFSTVASCMNNLGPALGEAAFNYQGLARYCQVDSWFCHAAGASGTVYLVGIVYSDILATLNCPGSYLLAPDCGEKWSDSRRKSLKLATVRICNAESGDLVLQCAES